MLIILGFGSSKPILRVASLKLFLSPFVRDYLTRKWSHRVPFQPKLPLSSTFQNASSFRLLLFLCCFLLPYSGLALFWKSLSMANLIPSARLSDDYLWHLKKGGFKTQTTAAPKAHISSTLSFALCNITRSLFQFAKKTGTRKPIYPERYFFAKNAI